MICEACLEARSVLYDDGKGAKLCYRCFQITAGRSPKGKEQIIGEENYKGRHYCDTCTWGKFQGVSVEGGYHGLCCVTSERKQIRKDDFCGEHPEALRERQERLGPSLDPNAMLSVAAGQFMGNYFSQKFKEGADVHVSAEEDERTLQQVAEAIVEAIITDIHLNMKTFSEIWTAMGTVHQEEIRRRWTEIVLDKL